MENQQENSSGRRPYRKPDSSGTSDVGKYMGAGLQIAGPVVAGVLIGQLIDRHFHFKTPVFTLVLSVLMIGLALYQFIKQFK